ncbi:hypothetical protein Tco_0169161 [Tanacetum coccineum]
MLAGEPSTGQSNNNVNQPVISDAKRVPQVDRYQPTPEGSEFWIPDAKNKRVEFYIRAWYRTSHIPVRVFAMMLADKPMQKCNYCGKYGYHDERNCSQRKKRIEEHGVYQAVDNYMHM